MTDYPDVEVPDPTGPLVDAEALTSLVSMVFRCCGKHVFGVDYLTQVGPFPTHCVSCGAPWTGTEVHAEHQADEQAGDG